MIKNADKSYYKAEIAAHVFEEDDKEEFKESDEDDEDDPEEE